MKNIECSREIDVVEAVSLGRWPEHCGEELRSHVGTCATCAEVVVVTLALHDQDAGALAKARIPSPGLMWWRSELRARREAMRVAERPMTLVHAFAGACAVGVLLALLVPMPSFLKETFLQWIGPMPDQPLMILQQHLPLSLAIGFFILLVPVALYVVFSDR